jgi:hypothetical protein
MLANAPRRNELSPFNGRGAVFLPLQRRSGISARGVETVDRDHALWLLQRNHSVDEFNFTVDFSIKEDAMPRYQFLNIETFHLIIADAKEAAWQLGLNEGPVVDATRDVNFGSPSAILVEDRIYEVLPLLS